MGDLFNVLGLISSTLSGFILLSISIRDYQGRTERQKAIANAYTAAEALERNLADHESNLREQNRRDSRSLDHRVEELTRDERRHVAEAWREHLKRLSVSHKQVLKDLIPLSVAWAYALMVFGFGLQLAAAFMATQ